jgi:hypothetical protein
MDVIKKFSKLSQDLTLTFGITSWHKKLENFKVLKVLFLNGQNFKGNQFHYTLQQQYKCNYFSRD